MALLQLQGIGKIYASEGAIAVGIRGVDLSFDKGEFVCITGKSGSGKSTLLNVISGMDSYEEGELLIEGETTSHYLEPDREAYREKYISFIFQDYNIIESFTVLENVELALMHIDDRKERRTRALELIERVGLSSHVKHKGSKLSGGQKQRTVIARALAKDSPIILADEPTGNLDSQTSKEIIELLGEIAKDKLLIVVTHNFDDFKEYATRHVRIYDGAIEADELIAEPTRPSKAIPETCEKSDAESTEYPPTRAEKSNERRRFITRRDISKGATLGAAIFKAKPKLSTFLAILLLIGTLGIFLLTSICSTATDVFSEKYMFTPIEGRVIITKRSGQVITDAELETLKSELSAKSYLHYDVLLDQAYGNGVMFTEENGDRHYEQMTATFGEDFGDDIVGRYPTESNEVLLKLPIGYKTVFGKDKLNNVSISYGPLELKVTGVCYYLDNNLTGKILFTEKGFEEATASHYLFSRASTTITATVDTDIGQSLFEFYDFYPSYDAEYGKLHLSDPDYISLVTEHPEAVTTVIFTAKFYNYNYDYYDGGANSQVFMRQIGDGDIVKKSPPRPTVSYDYGYGGYDGGVAIHPALLNEIASATLAKSYTQASLFFENDDQAYASVETLKEKGYIAIPSDTTYEPSGETVLIEMLGSLALGSVWVFGVIFLALFIHLCSKKSLEAFSRDISIMRSMGIPVRIIRIGTYVRMLLSIIPAYIIVIITAILVYTTPAFNMIFPYLYFFDYVLIFLGVLLLALIVTHSQVKRLFGETVGKALKGGTRNA